MKTAEWGEAIIAAVRGRRVSSTGWTRANCPVCELRKGSPDRKSSMGLNVVSGRWACFRCKGRGKVRRSDLEGHVVIPADLDLEPAERVIVDPPESFQLLAEEPARTAQETKAARKYLRKRGIMSDLWEAADIGVCLEGTYRHRVIVPVYTPEGAWHGYVGRTYLKHERGCSCFACSRKYLNAKGMAAADFFYNHHAIFEETDEPVLVVEGCFDALAYWPNAVATLGEVKDTQFVALADASRPVVFVPDGDDWGSGQWCAWRLMYDGKENVGWIRLPPRVDPDEVPRDEMREAARESIGREEGVRL